MENTSKYYYRHKEYIKEYDKNMRAKGYGRHHIWATPYQWAAILTFARQIKKIRNPERIMGLDVLDNNKTFKLVLKKSVKQTDEEFFQERHKYDHVPFADENKNPYFENEQDNMES